MRNPFIGLLTAAALLACVNDINAPAGPINPSPNTVPVFTSLEISPSAFTLALIQTLRVQGLWMRARDQYGMDMNGGAKSFSSSNPGVATVSGHDGSVWSAWVTAVAPGEAEISASWTLGGVTKTAKLRVTVESAEGWSLKLNPLTLKVGSIHKIQTTVLDESGNARIQSPFDAAFTSDRNDVVALVEEWEDCYWGPCQAIYMLGVAAGEATITVRYAGLSGRATVTVVP